MTTRVHAGQVFCLFFVYFRGFFGRGGGGGGAFFRTRRSISLVVLNTGVNSDPAIVRTRAIFREETVCIIRRKNI